MAATKTPTGGVKPPTAPRPRPNPAPTPSPPRGRRPPATGPGGSNGPQGPIKPGTEHHTGTGVPPNPTTPTPPMSTYWDTVYAMFAQFGLQDIAHDIAALAVDPTLTDAERYTKLYELPSYQARFPAMKTLQQRGQAMSEAEYIAQERQYKSVLADAGLPDGFYDSKQDYANWMLKGVSPNELQARVSAGQRIVDGSDPALKSTALDYYGLDSGHLLAYVIDPNKAQPLIDRQLKTIEFGAAANNAQFNLDRQTAESMSTNPIIENASPSALRQQFGNAQMLAQQDSRVSSVEGTNYSSTDAIRAAVLNETDAIMASQQRAQREQARFSGQGAFGSKSLGTSTL